MRKENDTEQTPEQLKYLLQQAILRDYPNPERKGCLDPSILKRVVEQRLPHEDPNWNHVSHCSPCYRDFLDFRARFRGDRGSRD